MQITELLCLRRGKMANCLTLTSINKYFSQKTNDIRYSKLQPGFVLYRSSPCNGGKINNNTWIDWPPERIKHVDPCQLCIYCTCQSMWKMYNKHLRKCECFIHQLRWIGICLQAAESTEIIPFTGQKLPRFPLNIHICIYYKSSVFIIMHSLNTAPLKSGLNVL